MCQPTRKQSECHIFKIYNLIEPHHRVTRVRALADLPVGDPYHVLLRYGGNLVKTESNHAKGRRETSRAVQDTLNLDETQRFSN